MAGTALHITNYCVIGNGSVRQDNALTFNLPSTDINAFLLLVYQHFAFNYPKFYKMDNLSKLGWLGAELLLTGRSLLHEYQANDIGIVLSNQNSSLDADVKYWDSVQDFASPSLFVYTLPNIVTGEICIRNGFKGEDAFYITDGFDAQFIHQQVSYLLDNDILECCICGWVDVIGNEYKAALFLVEKRTEGVDFSKEVLNTLFHI